MVHYIHLFFFIYFHVHWEFINFFIVPVIFNTLTRSMLLYWFRFPNFQLLWTAGVNKSHHYGMIKKIASFSHTYNNWEISLLWAKSTVRIHQLSKKTRSMVPIYGTGFFLENTSTNSRQCNMVRWAMIGVFRLLIWGICTKEKNNHGDGRKVTMHITIITQYKFVNYTHTFS